MRPGGETRLRRLDAVRVNIIEINLDAPWWPVAIGREVHSGMGPFSIDLSQGIGDRIVVPKIGEVWWIQRRIDRWHLMHREDMAAARAGGDQGTTASVYERLMMDGDLTEGDLPGVIYLDRDYRLLEIWSWVSNFPIGGPIVVDVMQNEETIFAPDGRILIDPGVGWSKVTTFDTDQFSPGDILSATVVQAGVSVPGSYLVIRFRLEPVFVL